MTRKILGVLCSIVIIAASLTAASVWEGAAGIASVEEFPVAGHYVKSNAFPKNTIVEITNLENGVVVNAIVTDSATSTGVLAVLAPATADSLGIIEGGITRIRVRIPDGLFDASEFAMNSGVMDPDMNPAAAVALDRARYGAKTDSYAMTSPDVTQPEPAVIAAAPAPIEAPAVVDTTGIADLVPLEETVTVDPIEDVAPVEVVEETEPVVPFEDTPVVVAAAPEPTDAVTAMEPVSDDSEVAVVEPITEPAEVVEEVAEVPELTDDTMIPAETEVATTLEPDVVETAESETPVAADEFAASPTDETLMTVAEPSAVEESEPVADVAVTDDYAGTAESDTVAITDEPAVVESPVAESETPVAENAIVEVVELEPAEPLPPVAVVEDPAPVEPAPVEPAPVEKVAEVPVLPTEDSELPYVEELDRSAYYIQIAVMSEISGAKALVSKYQAYPLVVKKLNRDGKTLYRVMVGPISLDEYGAALERFRKLGFADAFVASARR